MRYRCYNAQSARKRHKENTRIEMEKRETDDDINVENICVNFVRGDASYGRCSNESKNIKMRNILFGDHTTS